MKLRRIRSTIKGPLILFVSGLVLVIALLVLWNVVIAVDIARIADLAAKAEEESGAAFHWTFIALGSVFFVAIIALFSILGAQLINEIRFTQRFASFVATFTHELNSPLASIKLFAQTLRRTDLPAPERERFLDLLLADVARLHAQIANVLRSAQVDSPHGLQLAPERTDLRAYLEEYVATRCAALERLETKASIVLLEGPSAAVDIDKNVFRQALDNVVDNALKYSRTGHPARIELAIQPRDDTVTLEVADDGRGVRKEDLDRVFGRFDRGQPPKGAARQQGTGLGLWIVDAIAQAHGGEVEARSPGLEQGTTLRLTLPVPRDGEDQPSAGVTEEALA